MESWYRPLLGHRPVSPSAERWAPDDADPAVAAPDDGREPEPAAEHPTIRPAVP